MEVNLNICCKTLIDFAFYCIPTIARFSSMFYYDDVMCDVDNMTILDTCLK